MSVASGDGGDASQARDLHWRWSPRAGASIAELADIVASPCPGGPVVLEGQRVVVAARDGGDASQARDLHWREPPRGAAIAELAIVVSSPCPGGPVVLEGQRVVVAARDGGDASQARDLHWRESVRGASIAKLAKEVVSPRPDGP